MSNSLLAQWWAGLIAERGFQTCPLGPGGLLILEAPAILGLAVQGL